MNLNFKNLPLGSMPYENIQPCKQMLLRLYENIPYLPELPIIDKNDNVINKTLANMPCITSKDGKLLLPESESDRLLSAIMDMEKPYNATSLSELSQYAVDTPFMYIYTEMLKRFKSKYTVVNLLGPFTLANSIFNRNAALLLTDISYRTYIIQLITIRALWYIYMIKDCSPETTPILIFDESLLYKYGTLKRTNDSITKDTVITIFMKVFQKLKKAGAFICVQSFEKCNWQLVFESNCVDMISFDAYNNGSSLDIIAPEVNKFVAKGGYINWGIVPVMNETTIKNLKLDSLYTRFITTLEGLADAGVSADLLYKNSTVSIQGNLAKYPILFAEKAVMMANQLSKKIPDSSAK